MGSAARLAWMTTVTLAVATASACGGAAPAGGPPGAAGADASGPDTAGIEADASPLDAGAPSFDGAIPTDVDQVWPGAGCGKLLPADQPMTTPGSPQGYKHWVVMGTGANLTDTRDPAKAEPRTFWVRVPADYDPNHPYRVVYLGQGCGGYQVANTNTFQLFKESEGGTEQAIYVALDIPEDAANQDCYDQRSGASSQEWEAFQLFQQVVEANYCVDLNHLYVAGYSSGGSLANMWGCYFAGQPTPPRKFGARYHVRAQAAVHAIEPDPQPACGGPVAAIWISDMLDGGNPFSGAKAALARVGRMNGCDTTYDDPAVQAPWHPEVPAIGDVCKAFTGCPAAYPVVFCTTTGYGKSDDHQRAIAAFSLFFDQIEGKR